MRERNMRQTERERENRMYCILEKQYRKREWGYVRPL